MKSSSPQYACHSKGFTYLGLLFFMAVMGAGLGAVGEVWHTVAKRDKEQELLFIGEQFKIALKRYQQRSANGNQLPKQLEDLLLDPRFPNVQRHLRRIYLDPMTGTAEWGLIKRPDGGIFGVYSLSKQKPLRMLSFVEPDAASTYADWKFTIDPGPTRTMQASSADETGAGTEDLPTSKIVAKPVTSIAATPDAGAQLACMRQRQARTLECQAGGQPSAEEKAACLKGVVRDFSACLSAANR
jgi:type II secretory pathway pseudopilin PulG